MPLPTVYLRQDSRDNGYGAVATRMQNQTRDLTVPIQPTQKARG